MISFQKNIVGHLRASTFPNKDQAEYILHHRITHYLSLRDPYTVLCNKNQFLLLMNNIRTISIQSIHHPIQVSCKGHPEQIQDPWCPRYLPDAIECQTDQQHKRPQKEQPEKSKQIHLHIKENNRPEEIHNKVYPV